MTTFYLIVTFFTYMGQGSGQLESQVMPAPYASLKACNAAGESARANFKGGAKVEWTCVAVGA